MAKTLLEMALFANLITPEQKEKTERYKKEAGVNDETAIRDTKLMSDEQIIGLYANIYHYPIENSPEIDDFLLAKQFKHNELLKRGFFPSYENGIIKIFTAQPTELLYVEDFIRERTGYKKSFLYSLATMSGIDKLIEQAFKEEKESVDAADYNIDAEEIDNSNIYDISENDSSGVVNLVNKIFREAVENQISDIHFEPQEDVFKVRFRIEGTLKTMYKLPLNISRQMTNRIKTMANMDVNNSKSIQDGNVRLEIFSKMVDLRISVIPAIYGENLVVRILDQNKTGLDISMLGFTEKNKEKFLKLIHRPQGIFLLTGPTGSGKSTSLYAALSVLNTNDRCIITFEDPVEYRMEGIVQVQMNPAMGVTFPNALKSGLRQDIEIALVGEIRDEETADIAFDAANTGHMVFSTLHTNSAASSILRLVKLGIEPYVVSRTLVGVINQRLAKRICPHCKEEYLLEADSPYRKVLGCGNKEIKVYRGRGCKECGGEGYKGRIAIQEFLIVDSEIAELLDNDASTYEIEEAAIKNGMVKIEQDGINKALSGETTLDEVHRTVFFDAL